MGSHTCPGGTEMPPASAPTLETTQHPANGEERQRELVQCKKQPAITTVQHYAGVFTQHLCLELSCSWGGRQRFHSSAATEMFRTWAAGYQVSPELILNMQFLEISPFPSGQYILANNGEHEDGYEHYKSYTLNIHWWRPTSSLANSTL